MIMESTTLAAVFGAGSGLLAWEIVTRTITWCYQPKQFVKPYYAETPSSKAHRVTVMSPKVADPLFCGTVAATNGDGI